MSSSSTPRSTSRASPRRASSLAPRRQLFGQKVVFSGGSVHTPAGERFAVHHVSIHREVRALLRAVCVPGKLDGSSSLPRASDRQGSLAPFFGGRRFG